MPDPYLNMQPAMPGKVQEGEHAPSPSCTTPGNLLSRRGGVLLTKWKYHYYIWRSHWNGKECNVQKNAPPKFRMNLEGIPIAHMMLYQSLLQYIYIYIFFFSSFQCFLYLPDLMCAGNHWHFIGLVHTYTFFSAFCRNALQSIQHGFLWDTFKSAATFGKGQGLFEMKNGMFLVQ